MFTPTAFSSLYELLIPRFLGKRPHGRGDTGPISGTAWSASIDSVISRSIDRKRRVSVAAAFSPTWRMPSA